MLYAIVLVHLIAAVAAFILFAADGVHSHVSFALFAIMQTQVVAIASWVTLRHYRQPLRLSDYGALVSGPLYVVLTGAGFALLHIHYDSLALVALVYAGFPFAAACVVGVVARQHGWRWTNSLQPGPPAQFSTRLLLIAMVVAAIVFALVSGEWEQHPTKDNPVIYETLLATTLIEVLPLSAALLGTAASVGPRISLSLVAAAMTIAVVTAVAVAVKIAFRFNLPEGVLALPLAIPVLLSAVTLHAIRTAGWRIDRATQTAPAALR